MSELNERRYADSPGNVLHWYDFICPFCYVGQQRNAILVQHGLHVVELAFQVHPEIPIGGIPAGPRNGPMYAMLERELREAGLPLHWPMRLPNTRRALAAAEWARPHQSARFPKLHNELFAAHFALGGSAERALEDANGLVRKYSVQGAPAWLVAQGMITGLRAVAEFERLAEDALRLAQRPGALSRKLS